MRFKMLMPAFLTALLLLCSCTPSGDADLILVDLDKSKPERLLNFYFGGYASPSPTNPLEAGLIVETDGQYYLNLAGLDDAIKTRLTDTNQDGVLDWDELEPFLKESYYLSRPEPARLRQLIDTRSYANNTAWMKIEVDGVMTVTRRHVYVERKNVVAALANFESNTAQILYPIGTLFIGEHNRDGGVVETTVMLKREDGFWDYYVYDQFRELAPATTTEPRTLDVPTRCVGCHFGGKKFEPENSYPSPATDGPHGPRGIYTESAPVDAVLVERLDEHNKRSDTVLGLYATVLLGEIDQKIKAGASLEQRESDIARAFGLLSTGD